jgi:hypothetical protein
MLDKAKVPARATAVAVAYLSLASVMVKIFVNVAPDEGQRPQGGTPEVPAGANRLLSEGKETFTREIERSKFSRPSDLMLLGARYNRR